MSSRIEVSDSQACIVQGAGNRFGLVGRYASRIASTTEVRTLESKLSRSATPIKFGRLARGPEVQSQPDRQGQRPSTQSAVPVHSLNVVAGHAVHPEPM
jgi:hypothetical protein